MKFEVWRDKKLIMSSDYEFGGYDIDTLKIIISSGHTIKIDGKVWKPEAEKRKKNN